MEIVHSTESAATARASDSVRGGTDSVGAGASMVSGMLLKIPEILISAILAVLIAFLVGSVIARYVFDVGVAWSDELARLLFIWIVFIGFAIGVRHRANVGVDWLAARLAPRRRRVLQIVQDATMVAFSLFFCWQSYNSLRFSFIQVMPALDITIAWLYLSVVVASILMVVYGIANLVESLRGTGAQNVPHAAEPVRPIE